MVLEKKKKKTCFNLGIYVGIPFMSFQCKTYNNKTA